MSSTFYSKIKHSDASWKDWYMTASPEQEIIPKYNNLKPFHRLLIVRAWCPDRTLTESKKYVTDSLGPQFADPVIFSIETMVQESRPRTPLINFLSMGSDPTVEIEELAKRQLVNCQSISMGQAQEIHARKLIDAFVVQGGWALLQNCHLGLEYMSELFGFITQRETFHDQFRVWITTEPHMSFPMSLLQIAIKFTSQPPAGLRAGLRRTYSSMSNQMFNHSSRPEYKFLLYVTSFLHTVVQERRKFGPLGWNIPYEFNYADWYASCLFMQNHCEGLSKKDEVSWVTIRYMIAEVQYGGRVTDDYDKRLLNAFASTWFTSGVYFDPLFNFYPSYPLLRFDGNTTDQYLAVIDKMPQTDPPPVYCLHANADITYQTTRTSVLLGTVIEIQPKESVETAGESTESIVARIAKDMLEKMPPLYEEHICRERYKEMGATTPLVIVLRQEIDRMQRVLKTVSTTLKDLLLAVDGAIIMNEALKDAMDKISDAQVPNAWKKPSWMSSSLGFWFSELIERNTQLETWVTEGRPKQFWMTGFFNPQGFLTAMKQEVARANKWPLDLVEITNTVTNVYREGVVKAPAEGVYVYGLFLEGAAWDKRFRILIEALPKVLNTLMPNLHITAVNKAYVTDPKLYTTPVYKKPSRKELRTFSKMHRKRGGSYLRKLNGPP
uniref:Dynein heavy chain 8, axonemal n=1 Tax=Cacopsylla melanoneura TaxID=428564 RepID=A0A8D8Y8J0_9HEMI